MAAYPVTTRFHPTFLYESLWNLAGFAALMWIARRRPSSLRDGDIGGLYFIWYGIGRAWVELLFRPDAWTLGGSSLPTAVVVSLAAVAAGLLIIVTGRGMGRPLASLSQPG